MNEGEWIPEEEVEEGWYPPEEGGEDKGGEDNGRAFAVGAKVRGALGSAVGGIGSGLAGLFAPSEQTRVQAHLRRLPNKQSTTPETVPTINLASFLPSQPALVEPPKDELADLFEVPQPEDNDINCDDLVSFDDQDVADLLEVDDEDVFGKDINDVISVSREDIMGTKPKSRVHFVRTNKPLPPSGLVGLQ